MSFEVLLSASAWDAVAAARALSSDTTSPYTIPDAAYQLYHEMVAEDISRFLALDYVVGTPITSTSPLATVANQQRYICTQGNGFTVPPSRITDVSYQATNVLANTSDFSYLGLTPFSPLSRFFIAPAYVADNPTYLTLRSEYRDVLDKISQGFYDVIRDPSTGLLGIDIYPVPTTGGLPIYVRYQAGWTYTTDGSGNAVYATFPEAYKRVFATLLYCYAVEQNLDWYARNASAKVGILQQGGSAEMLARKLSRLRNEAYQQLGGAMPTIVQVS